MPHSGGLGRAGPAHRVHGADVAWVAERLSARDWQIIGTINRLRLVTGQQLGRVHFQSLVGRHTREVVRGRVLHRLVRWQVLAALPRRIGGAPRGSAGSVFTLGPVGARLCRERQAATGALPRVRRPELPTERTVRHTLAVSDLYAGLVEQAGMHGAHILTFEAEPACWWPNGLGGELKPDAYAALELGLVREHWWIEVDLATESVPTLRRKLGAYLDFVARGHVGPGNIVPRVLITTPTLERRDALIDLVGHLPAPATTLCLVQPHAAAAAIMLQSLHE